MKEIELQRVKFPVGLPSEALPIYANLKSSDSGLMKGREQFEIPAGREISFCSYFNAFPKAHWNRNTSIKSVMLNIKLSAKAKVRVFGSDFTGVYSEVDSFVDVTEVRTQLPIDNTEQGGWYWFEITAPKEVSSTLEEAYWSTEVSDEYTLPKMNIAITTINKVDYIIEKMRVFHENAADLDYINKIMITDQGTDLVKNDPRFIEYSQPIADKLVMINQPNLGGAGGFSRGMYESITEYPADFVMLLDDDTTLEIESFRRSLIFASLCKSETIVGSHMFWTNDLPILNAYAERMRLDTITWKKVKGTKNSLDISKFNLRGTPWLHRRFDVNYNGWWMCLIPTKVIKKIGLALPMFIKWDDAEFCYRALTHGYKTVSFPTSFVWHENWEVKTDAIDWQAFYHLRNRLLTSLLHNTSIFPLVFFSELFMGFMKDILIYRYSVAEQKLLAIRNILDGPKKLAEDLPTRLPLLRELRKKQQDAQFYLPEETPPTRKVAYIPKVIENPVTEILGMGLGVLRQFLPTRKDARENPDLRLMPSTTKIYRIMNTDATVYIFPDGQRAQVLVREREKFFKMTAQGIKLFAEIMTKWYRLRRVYRRNAKKLASVKLWEGYFFENEKPARKRKNHG